MIYQKWLYFKNITTFVLPLNRRFLCSSFRFQHFHHLVGYGVGYALPEEAGNGKDSVAHTGVHCLPRLFGKRKMCVSCVRRSILFAASGKKAADFFPVRHGAKRSPAGRDNGRGSVGEAEHFF